MENEIKVHVAIPTDENYVRPLMVTVYSLLFNVRNYARYYIHILVPQNFSVKSRKLIKDVITEFPFAEAKFIEFSERIFRKIRINSKFTTPTLYRLVLCNFMEDVDQCLYLDSDLVVLGDLMNLYQMNLQEYYIGGVVDCGIQYNYKKHEAYAQILGIDSMKQYINAGVLLLNLKQMRQDGISEIFMETACNNYTYADQDVLNICCSGSIQYIELKYNLFQSFYRSTWLLEGTGYLSEELKEANSNPQIIHFAIGDKPWNSIRRKTDKIWWEYAARVLEKCEWQEMYRLAEEYSNQKDWEYLLRKCKGHKQIIIFGFSQIGQELYNCLKKSQINIRCFADNDNSKQGNCHGKKDILSVEQVLTKFLEPFFIIASQGYSNEIRNQLMGLGVRDDHIVIYRHKKLIYYVSLNEEYYELELRQILLKELGKESLSLLQMDGKALLDIVKENNYQNIVEKYRMNQWILL